MKAIFDGVREWLRSSSERREAIPLTEQLQLLDVGLDRDFVRSQTARRLFWHE